MKRREFLAVPAALAAITAPTSGRPVAASDSHRRFLIVDVGWPRSSDRPKHVLEIPNLLSGATEYTIDSERDTLHEALTEAAEINRECLAGKRSMVDWCVLLEIEEQVHEPDSFIQVVVDVDATCEERRLVTRKASVYRPTPGDVSRHVGRTDA